MSNKNRYSGMTVNERLFVSGNMEKFEAAVSQKDRSTVNHILKELEVDDVSINAMLRKYGLD